MILHKNNKGSGIAVIIYGVIFLLILIFTAINILNAKLIESGYNSLRDAVLAASSGSVIHFMTSDTEDSTINQEDLVSGNLKKDGSSDKVAAYDIYLQLALGYIINRTSPSSSAMGEGGQVEVNNFLKLNHKKVVNSTMVLLDDAIMRNRIYSDGNRLSINDTSKFKICMIFIEPRYSVDNYEKYFDIFMYTNGDCDEYGRLKERDDEGNPVGKYKIAGDRSTSGNMGTIYTNIQSSITTLVNENLKFEEGSRFRNFEFKLDLNPTGESLEDLVRDFQTRPYYYIVIKDFALPTIFDGVDTTSNESIIKKAFTSLSGDGRLTSPMCALNAGRIDRRVSKD